jgi:heme exporter protein A
VALKLIIDQLHLERGARAVIAGLSFAVAGGEALVLTGANGAGKTTLLRALAELLAPSAGHIKLAGGVPDATLAEQSHFIGHLNAVKASLTVSENLTFWAGYLGTPVATSVPAALDRFQLSALADIPAGYLSAGQKRRLGLARLLVAERPVWLLDEPTVSLDSASVAILGAVVNAHVAKGGIAIAATHLPLGLTAARELRLGAPPTAQHQARPTAL